MTPDDPRQAAINMLRPSAETLTAMLEGIISEGATSIRFIRAQLETKARSGKGLSGRTLVEWHKAEAMAMSRAKAITALDASKGAPQTYEDMLRHLRSDG